MSKFDRPKPEFLRDVEHDGSLLKRIEEIRKAENRAAPAPGFVTQPVGESYGGFYAEMCGVTDVMRGVPALSMRDITEDYRRYRASAASGRKQAVGLTSARNDTKEPDPYY